MRNISILQSALDELALYGCEGITPKQVIQNALVVFEDYQFTGGIKSRPVEVSVKLAIAKLKQGLPKHYGANLNITQSLQYVEKALSKLIEN